LEDAGERNHALLQAFVPVLREKLSQWIAAKPGQRIAQGEPLFSAEQPRAVALLRGLTLLAEAHLPKGTDWLPKDLQASLPLM
jgi:hypothetical protein